MDTAGTELDDVVLYEAVPVGDDLVQLYRELWVRGQCVERRPVGSPALESQLVDVIRRQAA